MAENKIEKWTEIEHLPEWDEEFYDVYTAKKHGKWVMLKTLKPELRENPRFSMLIEKEFDVRYNLCHPNIVMINDFEEVPGLGMCIITDDVYGDSLRKLIDKGEVNQNILEKILLQLPEAIAYIQKNHIVHDPIKPETIIFTENIRNLKLINVGFDQREHLTPTDASEDIYNYGLVLQQVLDAMDSHNQRYRRVAERCLNSDPRHRYRDIQDLKMALAGDSNMRLYITIIVFLSLMTIILGWLCWAAPSL
jgi:tRNA A-37 threonylcarbamoyl transferase component Bud32